MPVTYIFCALFLLIGLLQRVSGFGNNFSNFIAFYPGLFMEGELWRIFTYPFLQPWNMISMFFNIMVFHIMVAPLEQLWGRAYIVRLFFISTIGAALMALLFNVPLAGGAFISLTFMLIHGFLYPESKLYIFFILPVPVRYLAIFLTVMYISTELSQKGFWGLVFIPGMLCGVLYHYLAGRLRKQLSKIPIKKEDRKEIKDKMTAKILYDKGAVLAKKRELSFEEEKWIADLDKDVQSKQDQCSEYSFHCKNEICPPCEIYKACLKRYISKERSNL